MQAIALSRNGAPPPAAVGAGMRDLEARLDAIVRLRGLAGLAPERESRFRQVVEQVRADVKTGDWAAAVHALELLSLELCDE